MSLENPKPGDLRKNKVTFQVDMRVQNPDLSTTESWSNHIENVWIAIKDGRPRDREFLGREQNERPVECWGRTEVLSRVNSDMRFLWTDHRTGLDWTVYLDSQPIEIKNDHTYSWFSATAKREDIA